MKSVCEKPCAGKQGMALVVVLGFLAVLAVLAVSLIVTMRVERLATSSFAETVRARQLVHVALARALQAIDSDLANNSFMYPPWDVFTLTAGTPAITNPLPDLHSRLYVPASLTNQLPNVLRMENVQVGTTIVGRVGYIAVDISGKVDANLAGTRPRGRGLDGREIQLGVLPEIRNLQAFLNGRSNEWRRFESTAELYYLAGVSGNSLFTNRPVQSFATFSRFGADFSTNGTPKISLAGDAAALQSRESSIVSAFNACGIPNPNMVFSNLLDYVDTDSIPRDLDSFCTEAVPMVNEVIFSNSVTRQVVGGVTQYTHRLYMTVETWFPFGDRSFPAAQLVPQGSPIINVVNINVPELAINPSADLVSAVPMAIQPHTPNSFQQTTFVWQKQTNVSAGLPATVNIQVEVNSRLAVDLLGNRHDSARLPNTRVTVRAPPPGSSASPQIASLSVIDPRLNHDPANWALTVASAATPGRLNSNATGNEGPSIMYVRDFPLDQPKPGLGVGSVGELGFLSVGEPWRTIALYRAPPLNRLHPVLDHFTAATNRSVRRALINVNSTDTNALAAAFFALPLENYPGGGGSTVTVAAARTLGANVLNENANQDVNRSISLIGAFDINFLAALNGQLASPVLTNDAIREAIVRNAAELFSYRQNMFNIYLFAQSLTPAGTVGADARAIATVWRDPEVEDTAENDPCRILLRFFRWL
ncbi:MAG: hypothetical protein NZ740_00605 [Kiritimatiellae bacterium]|nr:hypothetical protein [Kiritimatiellia bacterium]MDW8457590.1 hypothetical protein [Verrucomicrobiota bacterium]